MARYVSGLSNITPRQAIAKARFVLEQSKASSIGNAANHRRNPLWVNLRHSFLTSDNFVVELTDRIIKPEEERTINHIVAELNRQALRVAKISK